MVPKTKTIDQLIGLYIDGLKSKCVGTFKSTIDRARKAPEVTLNTAEAVCHMKVEGQEKDIVAEILFYLTDDGRFVSLTHEGEAADKARALSIRNKLADGFIKAADKLQKDNKPKLK